MWPLVICSRLALPTHSLPITEHLRVQWAWPALRSQQAPHCSLNGLAPCIEEPCRTSKGPSQALWPNVVDPSLLVLLAVSTAWTREQGLLRPHESQAVHTSAHCCCCSLTKSCSTRHDPINCSVPGFPVPHHLLEFAQVHGQRISMTSNLCRPLLLCLQSFPASGSFPMN